MSSGFSLDLCTETLSLDLLSTDVFFVRAVPRALTFFLWQLLRSIFEQLQQQILELFLSSFLIRDPFYMLSQRDTKIIKFSSFSIKNYIRLQMDVQLECTPSITLHEGINYNDMIGAIGVILFKPSEINQLQKLIKWKCPKLKGVTLLRFGEDYWLLRECQVENEKMMEQVERMVGLTETVVCIELSNGMQSIIQKAFCSSKNEASDANLNNRLVFIKEIYMNKPSGSDIKYFKNIDEGISLLRDKSIFLTGAIMVVDLVQIYDCQKAFNIPKVRAIHRRYEQIRNAEQKVKQIDTLIFDPERSKGEVVKQIERMHFKKQVESKLLWKTEQMHKYRTWLQEEEQCLQVKCGRLTFLELNSRISFASVTKYNREWRGNSFLRLKQLFNKIGGPGDTNSVKDFQRQYREMRANLQRMKNMNQISPEGRIYSQMMLQLDNFYKYHQDVLENNSFSSINFIKEEIAHIWKYRNNVFKKIAAFILFAALAYCQDDYIRALTLYIVSFITLAIRF